MSKPAAKISPREQMAREIRKQNMDGIIQYIQKDLLAEKDPDRKKNITACLTEAKKPGVYISSSDTLFGSNQKASVEKNEEYRKKWSALDAQSKKLAYARRGTAEQMMAGTPGPAKLAGPTREQMLSVATYTNLEQRLDFTGPTTMHQIFARVRIPEQYRSAALKDGDLRAKAEAGTRFLVAFDTGSEVQTIERGVWDAMSGNGRYYTGLSELGQVQGATGATEPRTYVQVEIGYFRDGECKSQIGSWREIEAVYSDRAFEHNLSGKDIHKDFDFLLPKGHGALIMGTNKPAMAWEFLMRSKEIKDIALINEWAAAKVKQARAPGAQGPAA